MSSVPTPGGYYKTLEQQIVELWASRGLRVVKETFEGAEYRRQHGEPKTKAHRWIIEAEEMNPV